MCHICQKEIEEGATLCSLCTVIYSGTVDEDLFKEGLKELENSSEFSLEVPF